MLRASSPACGLPYNSIDFDCRSCCRLDCTGAATRAKNRSSHRTWNCRAHVREPFFARTKGQRHYPKRPAVVAGAGWYSVRNAGTSGRVYHNFFVGEFVRLCVGGGDSSELRGVGGCHGLSGSFWAFRGYSRFNADHVEQYLVLDAERSDSRRSHP